jgi:hypothetical protein
MSAAGAERVMIALSVPAKHAQALLAVGRAGGQTISSYWAESATLHRRRADRGGNRVRVAGNVPVTA